MNQWYYAKGDQKVGPFDNNEIVEEVLCGNVQPDTLVWREGMETWSPMSSTFIAKLVNKANPTAPPISNRKSPPPVPKQATSLNQNSSITSNVSIPRSKQRSVSSANNPDSSIGGIVGKIILLIGLVAFGWAVAHIPPNSGLKDLIGYFAPSGAIIFFGLISIAWGINSTRHSSSHSMLSVIGWTFAIIIFLTISRDLIREHIDGNMGRTSTNYEDETDYEASPEYDANYDLERARTLAQADARRLLAKERENQRSRAALERQRIKELGIQRIAKKAARKREQYKQTIYKRLGGNPLALDEQREYEKWAEGPEARKLFEYVFHEKISWRSRYYLMSDDQTRFWEDTLLKEKKRIFKEVRAYRKSQRERYDTIMKDYDKKAAREMDAIKIDKGLPSLSVTNIAE